MLELLTVANYALIDKLSIHFHGGLNILSGETGAGKSILIGALGFVLGSRADSSQIRERCEQTTVSAAFQCQSESAADLWLRQRGFDDERKILLRRVLNRNGKSSIFINGGAASLKELRQLADLLLDLHGQHQNQSLFDSDSHRQAIDDFAAISKQVEHFTAEYQRLSSLQEELKRLIQQEKELEQQRQEKLRLVAELRQENIQIGEQQKLVEQLRILSNSEKLFSLYQRIKELARGGGSTLSALNVEFNRLGSEIVALDPRQKNMAKRVESAAIEIEDAIDDWLQQGKRLDFDQGRLDEGQNRLARLQSLRKKYNQTDSDALLVLLKQSENSLEKIDDFHQIRIKQQQQVDELAELLSREALQLSEKRQQAGSLFARHVTESLHKLGMEQAEFIVSISQNRDERGRAVCGRYGIDRVEFFLSANQGEKPQPLQKVASGGEISRVMLALKSQLMEHDQIPCQVFDEIESGIGGAVALAVGDYMRLLAKQKQVISITHLASLAVRADNHIVISKKSGAGRVTTEVRQLHGDARVEEIARMLSGHSSEGAALNHARKLLQKYSEEGI